MPTFRDSKYPSPAFQAKSRKVTARGAARKEPKKSGFQGLLETARKRFKLAAEAERLIREEALEDFKFYLGDQWPDQIKSDRELTGRPWLTINRLPQFAKQIINAQRQSRPAIQVNPVGDGADVDTAEIIQGLTRHIEVNSDGEIAYDTAFEHAVIGGFGHYRILTDYASERSNDQEILIEPIDNPFCVYLDPTARKRDRRDAKFAFIVEDIDLESYKEDYPDSEVAGLNDFRSIGDSEREWFQNGSVRVAEYFFVKEEEVFLAKLTDGTDVVEDEMPEGAEIEVDDNGQPVGRMTKIRRVYWCKMNAREILEPRDGKPRLIPGKWIPIVTVLGDELIVEGKRHLIGIVRHARDAQRMYNYARSGIVEQIALASKAPWIVAEGQIEGHEEEWRQSNVRNLAVLPYKPRELAGSQVPPPIRNTFEPPIRALTQSLIQSDNDLKATTGIYDASLGERGPDESGKAILARKAQGEMANSNLQDNLSRSIRHGGRIVLGMIPSIYDTARVVRIVNPDQSHKMVPINQPVVENGTPIMTPAGLPRVYDVTLGQYDVTISVGPSYHSRRQEFVESVLNLVKAVPQVMQFVMDLLVRNMDWPGADEIAERLKKMLPPQLQDSEGGEQQEIPPEIQGKLQALMQQNAMLIQQLENSTEIIRTKRLELESRERIANLQAQVQIIAAELKAKSSGAETLAKLEYDAAEHRLDLLHEGISLEQDAETNQAERQRAQQKQNFDQQHALAQQQQQPAPAAPKPGSGAGPLAAPAPKAA